MNTWRIFLFSDARGESHKIFWEDPQPVKGRRLEFDGVFFMLLGTAVYDCQQGKDRNTALKMRTKKEKEKVNHA